LEGYNIQLLKREQIEKEKQWKTEHIFENKEKWLEGLKECDQLLTEMIKTKEEICMSAKNLLSYIKNFNAFSSIADKVYVYVFLKKDENIADPKRQELSHSLTPFVLKYAKYSSSIKTKFIEMGAEKFKKFTEEIKELEFYQKYFDDFFRYQPHKLSEIEEELLSQVCLLNNSQEIYRKLLEVDLEFPIVKNKNGKEIRLTEGNYSGFMKNEDREVRKQVFKALHTTYKKFENTFSSILYSSLKEEFFITKTKNYERACNL
jgi:oligoendopeptidase F